MSTIPDLINDLPWKLDDVVTPVQSLSSGGFVVDPIGVLPNGASTKFNLLLIML